MLAEGVSRFCEDAKPGPYWPHCAYSGLEVQGCHSMRVHKEGICRGNDWLGVSG